jgi:hypothetical protein
MMACKILVIEKIEKFKFFIIHLRKQNTFSNLSVEQVLKKYDGFEGACLECISEKQGSKILDSICIKLLGSLGRNKNNFILLYLGVPGKKIPTFINEHFYFAGYEYGFIKDEINTYSSIFNEILFGDISELISFNKRLNQALLFDDLKTATDYLHTHQKLSKEGKEVSYEKDMRLFEVWKFKKE